MFKLCLYTSPGRIYNFFLVSIPVSLKQSCYFFLVPGLWYGFTSHRFVMFLIFLTVCEVDTDPSMNISSISLLIFFKQVCRLQNNSALWTIYSMKFLFSLSLSFFCFTFSTKIFSLLKLLWHYVHCWLFLLLEKHPSMTFLSFLKYVQKKTRCFRILSTLVYIRTTFLACSLELL